MSGYKAPSPAQPRGTAWRELRPLLRPYRVLIAIVALTVLLAEAFAVIPPLLMARIIDDHLAVGVQRGVLALALLFLGARAVAEGLDFVVTYLTGLVAQKTLRDLRVRLFAHLQRLPLSYYDRTPLGDAISRCTADVDTIDTLFTTGISRLLTRMVQLLTALAAMVILSPTLALFALLLIPPLALVTRFFQVRIRDAERDRRRVIGALNVHLQETLSGVEVVRTFGHENDFIARFRLALGRSLDAYRRALSYNVFYTPLLTVLVATGVAFLLWVGTGGLGLTLGISIGTLTAFILLFQRFFERIVQVLEIPAGYVPSPKSISPLEATNSHSASNSALVELRDVSFGYIPGHPVLHGITLAVQPGEQLALVGRTGAGKSSAIHLLCGLYAPWSGQVCVAGTDPCALSDAERRHVVGVVPQMVQLFGGTVRENLTLRDASAPRESVEQATRIAGIDRFVSTLPDGYDTRLSGTGGGKGIQLSEGQQQLLSLARALVWDPALLLLDEATAAVDNVSEAQFRTALRAALRGDDGRQRAVITVAHRLSTAREADRVVVLDGGHVVEQGAPEDLICQGGKFAALVELEAAGWNWQSDL
jgi:ATP-binding cassette subfamily B multidrug efflux pump